MPESAVSIPENDPSLNLLADKVLQGETLLLTRNGEAVARVAPVVRRAKTGAEIAGSWPAWRHLTIEEAEAFGTDIENARRDLPPLRDPWESS